MDWKITLDRLCSTNAALLLAPWAGHMQNLGNVSSTLVLETPTPPPTPVHVFIKFLGKTDPPLMQQSQMKMFSQESCKWTYYKAEKWVRGKYLTVSLLDLGIPFPIPSLPIRTGKGIFQSTDDKKPSWSASAQCFILNQQRKVSCYRLLKSYYPK